ncbi:MAG: sensor histidine kinase [Bdellovibrionota bacterium]
MFSAKNNPLLRPGPFLKSIRARLTGLYLALLAITLGIFCAILYQVFVRNHQQEFDYALYNHGVDVAQSFSVDFSGEYNFNQNALIAREKVFPFSLGKSFVQIVSLEGVVVYRSPNLGNKYLPLSTSEWQAAFDRGFVYRTLPAAEMNEIARGSDDYRQITYLAHTESKPLFILQIAVPMNLLEREADSLLFFFLMGIPITLLLAGVGGLYLANKALEPVRGVILKAEQLNPSNLSERLPEHGTDDEIRQLTVTLNGLLGRIERAFESHEHFIADASHQLKTPLAILRGELDVFRSRPRSAEEMDAFVDSASQELRHMSRLMDDLLLLAKMEAGSGSLTVRDVRLDEILLEIISRFEVLAKKKGVAIKFHLEDLTAGNQEDDFVVKGDPDLLQSMFRNLVDNAIKYSPENSPVEVRVINEAYRVVTQIHDLGPEISPDQAERLFRRYERGNLLVSKVSGTGLGLPIARRIAEMHGGNISILLDNPPGKAFRVEMKKV